MTAREYFQQLQDLINRTHLVLSTHLSFDEIDQSECYIRGTLQLFYGYKLHVAEYVITEPTLQRIKYRYHLQDSDNQLVARWDNAPHHQEVDTFPDHQHDANDRILASMPMDIPKTLEACITLVITF